MTRTNSRTARPVIRCGILAGIALGAGVALVALAGPLDPPSGPVASTHKTLAEVERRIAITATNTTGDGAAAGIRIAGARSRIEGNNCSGNNVRIDAPAQGNVVVVVHAVTSGGFSGSSGGTPPGSTDPNANFTY